MTSEEVHLLYNAYNIPQTILVPTNTSCDIKVNTFIPGSVLLLTNFPTSRTHPTFIDSSEFVCEQLKEWLRKLVLGKDIKYVDYKWDEESCYIRFGSTNACSTVCKEILMNNEFTVWFYNMWNKQKSSSIDIGNDAIVVKDFQLENKVLCRILEGDEECLYWDKIRHDAKQRNKSKNNDNNEHVPEHKRLKICT